MRRRILVLLVVVTATAVVALFVPAALALRSVKNREQRLELQNEALVAAAQFETTGEIQPREGHTFGVYASDGLLLTGRGPTADDPVVLAATHGPAVQRLQGDLVAGVPISGGRVLRAAESANEARDGTAVAVAELGVIALAVVALTVAVGAWMSRRLNRPLADLEHSAVRLGAGDFSVRAGRSGVREVDAVGAALNAAAEELGELLTRERELTSHTSHQLRTPLAGMRVAVESEMSAPREDRNAVLEELVAAIERMDEAITNLISLRREAAPTDARSNMNDLVEAAASRWRPTMPDRRLEATTPPYPVLTSARAGAIEIALDVLLDNAVEHGSGTVRVSLSGNARTGAIVVTDDGTFLSTADPFSGGGEGHRGVGLRMARRLAEAESCCLRLVERDPTTFVLTAPASRGDAT